MKVKIEKLKKSEVKLTIEVPKEELSKYEEEALKHINEHIEIPGFRKGHAPKATIIAKVGEQAFNSEVMETAIPKTYMKAVIDEKLKVVSHPKVVVVTSEPFVYTAEVAILPDVKMKDYNKIEVKPKKVEVTEKEVDETVEELRKYRATFKKVERAAKKGDRAEVDFEGFDKDDKPIDKTKSKNHPVVLGEGTLIPGFEDELVGLKTGDKKEFDIKFPDDYRTKDFQGKKVKFKVEIKLVEEMELPEVNEGFIEKVTGKKQSLDEFKAEVKKRILEEKEMSEKTRRENEYLEKLLEYAEVELPDAIVDEEIDFMVENTKMEVERMGLQFEDYLSKIKKDLKTLREQYKAEAEKRVKLRLVLAHLFKEEKLDVSEKEVDAEIDRIASSYPEKEQSEVKKHYKDENRKHGLENHLRLDKFFAKHLG